MLLKKKSHDYSLVTNLYQRILMASRAPVFYAELGVKDEFEPRFEVLILHVSLIMKRLLDTPEEVNEFGDNVILSQALFDILFEDMEYALRETGVGDLGVPKHVKRMMKAYNGRYHSYEEALKESDNDLLTKSLLCNIYADQEEVSDAFVERLIAFVRASSAHLEGLSASQILSEDVLFVGLNSDT